MSTTLGGVTIPDPMYEYEGMERISQDVGAWHELADGTIVYDYVGRRLRWILRWQGITNSERTTLGQRYLVKTTQTFVPPDGSSFTVIVVPNSWRDSYIIDGDGTKRRRVEMALEEATV